MTDNKESPPVLTPLGENMKHWNALKTTDPKYTKKVTFGRQFTSINSQWQLEQMTRHFGPVGKGWGYDVLYSIERITDEYILAIADVTIWTGFEDSATSRNDTSYGPVRGMSPIVERGKNGLHFDDDAGKKAMTDALTKGLSHLGLSADVFLGLFDDNKYVANVAKLFKEPPPPEPYAMANTPPSEMVDEADRALITPGNGDQSQYEVNKRKQAESFLQTALGAFSLISGSEAVARWYDTPVSPKGRSKNRDAAERLKENFPDLGDKLETAADNARSRFS
jgi:hypothetical protein